MGALRGSRVGAGFLPTWIQALTDYLHPQLSASGALASALLLLLLPALRTRQARDREEVWGNIEVFRENRAGALWSQSQRRQKSPT